MKRNSTLLVITFLALATLCSAQGKQDKSEPKKASSADRSSLEQAILSKEKQGWDAMIKADGNAFKSIHTDDAIIVSPAGVMRIADFANILGMFNMLDCTLNEVKFTWADDNTVVLTYKAIVKTAIVDEEGKVSQNVQIADDYHSSVWANRGGKWMGIFHQVTAKAPAR